MRLVVPVEYVLAALPGAELLTDRQGYSKVIVSGVGTLPVIEVEEGNQEWPDIFIGRP